MKNIRNEVAELLKYLRQLPEQKRLEAFYISAGMRTVAEAEAKLII